MAPATCALIGLAAILRDGAAVAAGAPEDRAPRRPESDQRSDGGITSAAT